METGIPFTCKDRTSVQGVFSEVDRTNRFEEDLRNSKETIEALLNASTDLAFLLDTNGNFLSVNQALAARLGKTADELRGTNAFDHISDGIRDSRWDQYETVLQTGKSVRFEDCRNGRLFDNSMRPVLSDDGKVKGVVIFVRDVTESRSAEQLINIEKQKFQLIAEHSPLGMGMVNSEGKVVYSEPESHRNSGIQTRRHSR